MSPLRKKLLIITVLLAAVMELIDTTIVNVALNYMSGNLGATLEDTSWVITSYAIANVIVIPMTSFLTSKLGRRNYYIGSIIMFVTCSLMCGLSRDIWTLVFFRFLQGIGGGALLSVSQAVIFELFPKEKHGAASAIFGIGVFIGPTIGPTLGGYITENYSWPWIFFVNIPVGIAAAISCYMLLTEPPTKTVVKKIDWTGIALLAIGIGTLQTVLERGQTDDWFSAPYILWFTVTSILSLTAFVIWELRVDNPVVDLRVLKSKTLSIAAVLTFITGVGMFTSIFLVPVISQRLLNFTPTQTGLLMLPGAILAIVALIFSGKVMQSGISPVFLIVAGFGCFIFFNWHMSQMDLDATRSYITYTLIFRAVGMAFLTVPLTALAVSSLAPKDVPQGAALNNMMRQLGGSFGISIVDTYYAHRIAVHRTDLISHITADNLMLTDRINNFTHYFQTKGSTIMDAHARAIGLINTQVIKQTSILGYLDSFMLIGGLFVITLPLLLFVKAQKQKPGMIISDH